MRIKSPLAAALLAVLLLLGGCYREAAHTVTPTPTATPTPPTTPTPEPSAEPKELWGFPIDETHDAFEVDTNGKLGTVLVTVEQGEYESDGLYDCTFSVWDANDLTTPIQTFEQMGLICWYDLIDANFDGYMDFCYTYYHGVANATFGLYLWDESQEQFHLAEKFFGTGLWADEETETLRSYTHYSALASGMEEYRWEDGELVCFRYSSPDTNWEEYVTYELVDGEMVEVSREPMQEWSEGNVEEE